MIKRIVSKLVCWALWVNVLDLVGHREENRTYLGHGDYSSQRGWVVFGKWVSFDKD
jgi:hypothetical protein